MARPHRVKKVDGEIVVFPPREGAAFLSDLVGDNIRSAREFFDLTKEDLAARMKDLGHGWYGPTVSKVERGERLVTVEEILCLALALKVTVYDLLSPRPRGDEGPELIDLGPGSAVSTLPRADVDQLYLERGKLPTPPPLVTWEENKATVWTLADNEVFLGALLDAAAANLGTEAAKALVGRWNRTIIRRAIVRFDEDTGYPHIAEGSPSQVTEGLEALEAIIDLLRARAAETE